MPRDTHTEVATASKLLSSQRRVYALSALREADSSMTLSVLAYETALREVDSPSDVADEHVKRVEIALKHTHLPKLADYDVVQYDSEEHRVSLADDAETIESILEAVFR